MVAIAAMLGHERFRAWGDVAVAVTSEEAVAGMTPSPPKVIVVADRGAERALGALPGRSHVLVASAKADGPDRST